MIKSTNTIVTQKDKDKHKQEQKWKLNKQRQTQQHTKLQTLGKILVNRLSQSTAG